MADTQLDKVARLAKYLDWTLRQIQQEAGSNLADTRAGELLGNAAAAAQELLTVIGVDPRVIDTVQAPDESKTRH